MKTPSNIAALIVAAGRGQRAGAGVPKQYRLMPDGSGSILAHSIAAFAAHGAIGSICVVIHENDVELYNNSINELNNNINFFSTYGGATRQASVLNGLSALAEKQPDAVLIHDAARPFLSDALISRCIAALQESDAAIAALPVTDTLKRGEAGHIQETVARDGLYRAQTPQAFAFDKILAAHQAAAERGDSLTDDAAVAEAAGLQVALVEGDSQNIKLTFEDDFVTPASINPAIMPRTGLGYDVHRFGEPSSAQHIMLGGVAIAHDRALIGHSDADVALHAITDALLGALAEGDIGDHFPPSDAANKDRPSADFLAHAVTLAEARDARISHIDLTLICEQPKIGPNRAAMRQAIADLCAVPLNAVSVKATTTEGLGFAGREEGLAAQAVVTVLERGA